MNAYTEQELDRGDFLRDERRDAQAERAATTYLDFPPPAPTGDITGQTFLIKFDGIGFAKSKCVEHQADRYKFDVEVDGEIKPATIFWDEWLEQYSLGRVQPYPIPQPRLPTDQQP